MPGSNRFQQMPRPSQLDTDHTGFSHGSFSNNNTPMGGYADRNTRRGNLPSSLNSATFNQNGRQNLGDVTPGTGFEMNFTPLLPSQLLLGSPFQPNTPSNFQSPQFTNFNQLQQNNNLQQHSQQHFMQNQQGPMSPSLYNGLTSPNTFGQSFLSGPQSPTFGTPTFGADSLINTQGMIHGTSRTVYLGNIPPDTSAEEILGHVRSGQIESVRLLPDKNCAFISFLDGSSAHHFHSDAILKKLSIRGQDIKIGWGKPSQVPTSTALAVQQSQASRNVYLGNLPENIAEEEIREDLGKFGPIDTIKLVREKNIGFVHFLSIGNAVKAVAQLPQEPKWGAPRRVYYGKDRCAYVSKTQQQNAAQYLGIAPGYAHLLHGADRDLISNALAQQSVAAAAVATTAGGATNLGNRTVYLGNIHPETTIEEICNVVRGGLLHHIRYIPDKHICFVTFIDPTSAASFYALSNLQGLMIHNRRLKIGWGKHSGALPAAIALAVTGGASRNVYVGNLDESFTEERLRQDFSEYGEIELVNTLREKSCAFVNFTNIANAIKAIEAVRGKDDYSRFKVNFGKDRCGNPPRQNTLQQQQQQQQSSSNQSQMNGARESISQSPLSSNHNLGNGSGSPSHQTLSPPPTSASASVNGAHPSQSFPPMHGSAPSAIMNAGNNNPLTMYLNQVSNIQLGSNQNTPTFDTHQHYDHHGSIPADSYSTRSHQQQPSMYNNQQQYNQHLHGSNASINGFSSAGNARSSSASDLLNRSIVEPSNMSTNHAPSSSFNHLDSYGIASPTAANHSSSGSHFVNGLLAPVRANAHARAVSLPAFSQEQGGNNLAVGSGQYGQHGHGAASSNGQNGGMNGGLHAPSHRQQQSSFSGFGGFAALGGFAHSNGNGDNHRGSGPGGLNGWVEES
ncbi:hypothetical protein MMC25_001035 [Agyrium rufum]|nr:hypothetical protein [Agyrium rufum]